MSLLRVWLVIYKYDILYIQYIYLLIILFIHLCSYRNLWSGRSSGSHIGFYGAPREAVLFGHSCLELVESILQVRFSFSYFFLKYHFAVN